MNGHDSDPQKSVATLKNATQVATHFFFCLLVGEKETRSCVTSAATHLLLHVLLVGIFCPTLVYTSFLQFNILCIHYL